MGRPIKCKICGHKFSLNTKQRIKWEQDYMRCPSKHCGALYCCLTKTERRLRELQDIYLINRSGYIFGLMYQILTGYTRNLILKNYSTAISNNEDLQYYTHKALSFLVDEFLKDDTFKITSSFGGFLGFKIKQAVLGVDEQQLGTYTKIDKKDKDWKPDDVFKKKNIQIDWKKENENKKITVKGISLNYKLPDGKEIEYEDLNCTTKSFQKSEEILIMGDFLSDLIFELGKTCENPREDHIRLLNIYLHISSGETSSDKFWKTYNEDKHKRYGKYKYLQSMELLRENLKRLHDDEDF